MEQIDSRSCSRRIVLMIVILLLVTVGRVSAANIGTVVPVVGTVADLAYDAQRGLVYLANSTENTVNIYSVGSGGLIGSGIPVGQAPSSLAMSPDGQKLYVANSGSLSVSIVDLNQQQVVGTYSLSATPNAVAMGSDGLLLILGSSGLLRLNPTNGLITPLPISVPAVPPGLPPIAVSPTPAGFLAGMVTAPSGSTIIGLSSTRLFVYDVPSGTVISSRNVTGLRAILSVAPDGSRFMAGPFLFDTQTLNILGRTGTVAATLTGGSAFSPDGGTVYATFSTQPAINPLNTNNPQNPGGAVLPGVTGANPLATTKGVLQVLRSSSLTQVQGLRLPEAINLKIIASPDGQYLFAISTSGLLVIPIGQFTSGQLPVLGLNMGPNTANVVLSVNVCSQNLASAQVQISNLGGGRLTYTAAAANSAASVILGQRTGLAPSNLVITFNPQSVTTRGTIQAAVVLVSPEAVNIEPAILVNLNYQDTNQRGTIVPINGVGADLVLDQARQRLYIANYTQDQIEVFSLPDQTFLPPVRVGNRPLSMAMTDPSTLVVANAGAEHISVVDLNQLQEVQTIPLGPVPLNATPLFPRYIAVSSNAILFTAIPLPATLGAAPATGSVWQLSLITGTAFPRLNLGPGTTNVIQGNSRLVAPANGSAIAVFENNGTLVLYDPNADAFPLTRTAAVTGFRGTTGAAPDGSYFVFDDTLFNNVLGFQGTLVPVATGPGTTAVVTFGVSIAGTNAMRVQPVSATNPATTVSTASTLQSLQMVDLASLQVRQQFLLPEAAMDVSPTSTTSTTTAATATRLWPPNVVAQEIGVNGQTQLRPHGVVADSANNAYLLSVSGLSIVPTTPVQGSGPQFNAGSVVNGASFTTPVGAGSLISIFGSNLANSGSASSIPLPTTMGGSCVTVNGAPIPLLYTSPGQINAQLPPGMAASRVTIAVHSASMGQASPGVQVQVNTTAPGVFSLNYNGATLAELFHSRDFTLVTPGNPATRDEFLILYATGLGPVSPVVPAGLAGGSSPPSVATQDISVLIGGHPYDVQFAGLAPGFVGAYQLNIYVPGDRVQGDQLPVVVTAGGASSTTTAAPVAAIH